MFLRPPKRLDAGYLRRDCCARIAQMRAAMAKAAAWLDYSRHGRLAEAVLMHFESVASGRIPAVPATTRTPLPMLDLTA